MNTAPPEPPGPPDTASARGHHGVLCLIGAGQGVVYWVLLTHWPVAAVGKPVTAAIATFTTALALAVQFAWTGQNGQLLFARAAKIAAVLALTACWVWWQVSETVAYRGDIGRLPTWGLAATIVLYIVTPYLQILHRTGRWHFPYTDLFFHSWCNFFVGLMGLVFVGVLRLLLSMWAALFAMIGIEFFKDIFSSPLFMCVASTTIFAYGLAAGRDSARIIDAREAVLAVFRALLPVLDAMILLFVAALLVTGIEPLWTAGASSTMLLAVVCCAIVFLNAAFEDGRRAPPRSALLRHATNLAVMALPFLAAAAVHALDLRIRQHGLTIERFLGAVVAMIVFLYGFGYAIAAVWPRRGVWLGAIRGVNIAMSVVVAVVAVLLHTPVLDPMSWSAWSQYRRLVTGVVDAEQFDYGYLRFRLGHVGFETLARLESLDDHPHIAEIRRGIDQAREARHYTPPGIAIEATSPLR